MKFAMQCSALALACAYAVPAFAEDDVSAQDDPILSDVIIVSGLRQHSNDDVLDPPQQIALPADTVMIAARAPGAGAIGNGALSGQMSYRGLFGVRVLSRVNGQRFVSGGPNAMDPPLHYAPSILLDRIEIARGVSPVSEGPSLAGAVNAQLQQVDYSAGNDVRGSGRMATQYRSVDNSYALGGLLGLANNDWRLGVIASRDEGDDYEFPGGIAGDTSFERSSFGVHAGVRVGEGEIFAEYRRSETDPSGNPSFAMDIFYVDTDLMQGGYRGQIADGLGLEVKFGHVSVNHGMDNNRLRSPKPVAMRFRETFASADTYTGDISIEIGNVDRNLTIGADFESVERYVRIRNPLNVDFFLEAQPGFESDRFGGFVQWRGGSGAVEFEAGARLDFHDQKAGVPELGSAVPMGPVNLANAYALTNRETSDTTWDLVLRGWIAGDLLTPRLVLAHKTRVPTLLERFAWLPTQASYGLADGNIYIGNQALEPEEAWIAELGVDIDTGPITLRPTVFYRRIDDYIQGTPFDETVGVIDSPVEMIASMNGDATPLMFRNVDAELYGLDLDFRAEVTDHLSLDGTASFVRAKRRDIDDNLYRVPPASLRLAVIWQKANWSAGAEVSAAADQAEVSATNNESPSTGYGVVNLFASYRLSSGITLDAGVENLLDTLYRPHLAGVNQVGASDVTLGDRLPGAGRGVWVRASIEF